MNVARETAMVQERDEPRRVKKILELQYATAKRQKLLPPQPPPQQPQQQQQDASDRVTAAATAAGPSQAIDPGQMHLSKGIQQVARRYLRRSGEGVWLPVRYSGPSAMVSAGILHSSSHSGVVVLGTSPVMRVTNVLLCTSGECVA